MTATKVATKKAPTAPARTRKTWDVGLTIVLMAIGVFLAIGLGVWGVMLSFAAEGCIGACEAQFTVGFFTAVLGPAIVTVLALITTIVSLMRRRLSFWIPLLAAGLAIAASLIGFAIALAAVDGQTF